MGFMSVMYTIFSQSQVLWVSCTRLSATHKCMSVKYAIVSHSRLLWVSCTRSSATSECFQVLMLQSTTKGADLRRLLTKRMDLWENCAFDTLVQKALRCSESLKKLSSRKSATQRKRDHEYSINVFHRLLLQSKLRSAVGDGLQNATVADFSPRWTWPKQKPLQVARRRSVFWMLSQWNTQGQDHRAKKPTPRNLLFPLCLH